MKKKRSRNPVFSSVPCNDNQNRQLECVKEGGGAPSRLGLDSVIDSSAEKVADQKVPVDIADKFISKKRFRQ